MASLSKGDTPVRVESGEYTLAFDLGACVAIERAYDGKPIKEVLSQLEGDNPNVTVLLTVLWAGLKKHHDLSEDEVGHIVVMEELVVWGTAVGKAFAPGDSGAKSTARPRNAKAR